MQPPRFILYFKGVRQFLQHDTKDEKQEHRAHKEGTEIHGAIYYYSLYPSVMAPCPSR